MTYLIATIFDIVVGSVMLLLFFRFMIQFANVERKDPYAKSIYRITQVVDVFARIFPTLGGGRISLSAVALLFLLRLIFIWGVLDVMQLDSQNIGLFHSTDYNMALIDHLHRYYSPFMLFFVASVTLVVDFLRLCKNLIIASFVIGWIVMFRNKAHPALLLLASLSEPLITSFRKLLPKTGMLDLAPMIGFFLIILLELMVKTFGVYLINL
ncbi:hypothetical protein MOMA_04920 [Moraxella macacae 0408225]|uniref:YGGT family protein n=1 Tax=Moraxella macacae 0408225 TaxID=1230338 RepID=L2FAD9_9GAMM|nr:YggT family protein [Moraxella macacae]ELA09716.1 hypothetical protein MOMA_04920 [Moraxella macacae 0408225]